MRRLFLLLNTLLFVNLALAQIFSGEVVYEVDMDSFMKKMESEESTGPSNEIFRHVSQHIKNFQAKLVFSDNFSSFDSVESLSLGENDKKLNAHVKSLISEGTYYSNLKDSTQILVVEFDNKTYNVESNLDNLKWTLSGETKNIGNFTCYKATHIKNINGKETTIIAWYTPEIPKALGPKGYIGQLPGLILQLEDHPVTYYCSEIKLNTKQSIEWPEDPTISKESYDKILIATFEKVFGKRKKK